MQDIQSIDNGVGSLFIGGGGGGERRLKPQSLQGFSDGHGGYNQASLKCPRCDSLNTKFCYYNNYNLSQPRFFCKGCRRYWTKGGVLRNVPVGGGCRKNKRSKKNPNNANPSSVAVTPTSELKSSNSQTSSDSSPATSFKLTEAAPTLFGFQESCFEPPMLDQCSIENHHMYPETGTFKSLMPSSSDQLTLRFNQVSELSSFKQQEDQDEVLENQNSNRQQWVQATGEIHGGVAAEDWGLFDQSYWWNNHDHQLNYFP